MKKCTQCGEEKELCHFYSNSASKDGKRNNCKICQDKIRNAWASKNKERNNELTKKYRNRPDVKKRRNDQQKEYRSKKLLDWELWYKAKKRSEKYNLPFNIDRSDIIIPKVCPVLGIELYITKDKIGDNSPTVDRIIPQKGYVKDNIVVISAKANRLKNNGSLEDIEKVYIWLKEQYGKFS